MTPDFPLRDPTVPIITFPRLLRRGIGRLSRIACACPSSSLLSIPYLRMVPISLFFTADPHFRRYCDRTLKLLDLYIALGPS